MSAANPVLQTSAWSAPQRLLHWLVALLVVAQIAAGFYLASFDPDDPARRDALGIHASIGASILVLMLVRLGLRLSYPVPALPDSLTPGQKRLARTSHALLYALGLALPVGGYLLVSAFVASVPVFGLAVPAAPVSEGLGGLLWVGHVGGAFALVALVVLHAAAALRHELVLHDRVLRRMLVGNGRPERPPSV